MGKRKNEKDHDRRKNPGAAEFFRKQRKARNEARPKQRWVSSSFTGTYEEFLALTNDQVRAIVPAHWERP
jgi:hypothetical protein